MRSYIQLIMVFCTRHSIFWANGKGDKSSKLFLFIIIITFVSPIV